MCGRNSGTVTNCYNTGNVTGRSSVGGVCGLNVTQCTVINCYNTGNVSGTQCVGGVCGSNDYLSILSNCYNTGNVKGTNYVGGVCEYNNYGKVINCYYLDTCGAAGKGISKTENEFQSGAVAYLLSQGADEGIWGQNLTFDPKDNYPVLGGIKVIQKD